MNKTEELRTLVCLLADYCPQSTNAGEPEPIEAGHPIHGAVVSLQQCFPDGKLPLDGRGHWRRLLVASRDGDESAFDHAERLTEWARGLLSVSDPTTLDPMDRRILEAIPSDGYATGEEITGNLGDKPSCATVRQRLRPRSPLRQRGFVEKNPGGQGYRRKV